MKQTWAKTSNEKLNIPMTTEEWNIVDFIAFESETSKVYPFNTKFDDISMDMIDRIVEECNGYTDDTETVYSACERILGINRK